MNAGQTIRPGMATDLVVATAVLARAFSDTEQLTWLQTDAEVRARLATAMFDATLRHLCPVQWGTEILVGAAGVIGVAVWAPPGRGKPSLLAQMLTMPPVIQALGFSRLWDFVQRSNILMNAFDALRPVQPHWHLVALGVDPGAQGAGAGSTLMRSGLQRCDRLGTPAYLECARGLVPFYQRFGFVEVGSATMPDGAPGQVGMWREPRSAPSA